MNHLPAYVALQRWAAGRVVVVIGPGDLSGPEHLLACGAQRVVVVGEMHKPQPGIESMLGIPEIPMPTSSGDAVLCLERFAAFERPVRLTLLRESYRVLGPGGVFAARFGGQDDDGAPDFWQVEEELRREFDRAFMMAELPWQGVSLAPVLDEDSTSQPGLALDESLLADIPSATHYVGIGTRGPMSRELVQTLTGECLLVPVTTGEADLGEDAHSDWSLGVPEPPAFDAAADRQRQESLRAGARIEELEAALVAQEHKAREAIETLRADLDALQGREADHNRETADVGDQVRSLTAQLDRACAHRDELELTLKETQAQARAKETDLAVLSRTVEELEHSLVRIGERAEQHNTQLQDKTKRELELAARCTALEAERDNLGRQLEVAIAEREGARQLSVRVEAELELARRKESELEEQIKEKVEQAAGLTADLQVERAKLEHQQALLESARSREEELSASAAQSAEQGRMLTEVAVDRDRLRQELGRRASELRELEQRLWEARDTVQKEKLENVRLTSDAERLQEQANRSREAEQGREAEVERLSRELHRVEAERAELSGGIRTREEQLERLREDLRSHAGDSGDRQALQEELNRRGGELGDLRAQLELSQARQAEATKLSQRREQQLAEAGRELEDLRSSAQEHASMASSLQGELNVKELEVEQLAASVADLQVQLQQQRNSVALLEAKKEDLQRELEHGASEQGTLRRRLREREHELEDLVSAHESSSVELYKLRRELEAAAHANEQLEGVRVDEAPPPSPGEDAWPSDAVTEVNRLKAQLAAQSRRHAEYIAQFERRDDEPDHLRTRVRALLLEIEIRAQEQEHILGRLDAAEQRIWEMTDASDRNAARLAASLAQLERHKEQLDETQDELEVTRKLLGAAQARALEQERLLASERARLARVGAEASIEVSENEDVDAVFAELEHGTQLVDLEGDGHAPAMAANPAPSFGVPLAISDREGSDAAGGSGLVSTRVQPRVVVEPLGLDEEWPGAEAVGEDEP